MTPANLEQIMQTGKPRRRNLTLARPKLEYKLIGHFNLCKVNHAPEVEPYLNKDAYVGKPIHRNLVVT